MEVHKVCKGGRLEEREGERREKGKREEGRERGREKKEGGRREREKSIPPSIPQHTHHSLPSWRRLCDYRYYLIRQHS